MKEIIFLKPFFNITVHLIFFSEQKISLNEVTYDIRRKFFVKFLSKKEKNAHTHTKRKKERERGS